VWLFAAILYVVGVLAAGGNRWIGGPVLLVLLLIALPQEYVTAPEALRVRAGLTRWAIPYGAITFVGESSLGPVLGKRVAVRIMLARAARDLSLTKRGKPESIHSARNEYLTSVEVPDKRALAMLDAAEREFLEVP